MKFTFARDNEGLTQFIDHARGNFQMTIPRVDLASITGSATETAIRSLSEFKDEYLIVIDGRDIIILDVKGLEEIQ